jgi:alkylation response protein AidB-like acyl-CoA dehydrogenase
MILTNKNAKKALELARNLAAGVQKRADDADRRGVLPPQDVAALRESGYLGISVPQEFGGAGLSLRDCVAAQIELAQGSASTAIVAGMQVHVFGNQREVRSWDEAWYGRLCTAAAQGALFNSIASEPALGSPSRGGLPATTAVRADEGDGWIVNGRKTWSTGGSHLTHMLVRVNIEDEPGVVLIEKGMKGSPGRRPGEMRSACAPVTAMTSFLPKCAFRKGMWWNGAKSRARPNVWFPMIMSSIYLGAAIAARHRVIEFALERVPTALGKPIATLPKIQRQIGEIDIALQAARSLLFDVAGEWYGRDEDRAAMVSRIAAAKRWSRRRLTRSPTKRCASPAAPRSPGSCRWSASSAMSAPAPCSPLPATPRWRSSAVRRSPNLSDCP